MIIITADQYKSIPDRDKPNWHYHAIEFSTKSNPLFPEPKPAQIKDVTGKLMDTYGKVILTWDPKDKLPAFPAQVEQVQHPFMVNQTMTPQMETNAGSFNQNTKILNFFLFIFLYNYQGIHFLNCPLSTRMKLVIFRDMMLNLMKETAQLRKLITK